MDETGGRRWRDWGVAVTALLALLMAAYTVGFLLGWGGGRSACFPTWRSPAATGCC
jgi:hypothetical protein